MDYNKIYLLVYESESESESESEEYLQIIIIHTYLYKRVRERNNKDTLVDTSNRIKREYLRRVTTRQRELDTQYDS